MQKTERNPSRARLLQLLEQASEAFSSEFKRAQKLAGQLRVARKELRVLKGQKTPATVEDEGNLIDHLAILQEQNQAYFVQHEEDQAEIARLRALVEPAETPPRQGGLAGH